MKETLMGYEIEYVSKSGISGVRYFTPNFGKLHEEMAQLTQEECTIERVYGVYKTKRELQFT